jgi:hypothetical protein
MKNQSISKENLKKIHDVACSTWQAKLEVYAKREPFSSEVELTSAEVNEMFEASDEKQSKVLNKFLKRDNGVMGIVTSYETACDSLGIKPNKNVTPYEKLTTIIKALNQGWYPNFDDENERKCFNYYQKKHGVFSFCYVDYYYTLISVPSALYLKDEKTAKYANETFFNEYKELYLE